jgi:NAD(P)-dependent dehydrogenase (short-subunit alcohol dehydrogenase family)
MDIQGRTAIVTGASSGIGEATARLLTEKGAKVVLSARNGEKLQQIQEELPNSLAVATDVTRKGDIDRLIWASVERFGGVDILVNNAGQGLHVPVEKIDIDDYKAIMELNVYAPLLLMQGVLPVMRKQGGGSIVNISSGTTRMVLPGVAGYASTKSALNMLSQTARVEFAPDNIVVSLIYPYITATNFHQNLRAKPAGGAALRRNMPPGHTAGYVAEHIVRCIETGETEISLVPDYR